MPVLLFKGSDIMAYKSLDEIYAKLLKDQDYIAKTCGTEVGNVLHEESEKIYREYIPTNQRVLQERRYKNGGFADRRNIKVFEPIKKGMKCSVSIRNITKARGENRGKDLDRYIEYGIYNSPNVPPRPVYQRTAKRIVKEKILEKAINKALEDKGWK